MKTVLKIILIAAFVGSALVASRAATPKVQRGPYEQMSTPTSIVLRWRTDLFTNSQVIYGTNLASLNLTNTDLVAVTNHEVTLTGLLPDTQYFYIIGTTNQLFAGADANTYFLTHPLPGTPKPIRVWIIGDAGTGTANQIAVRDAFYNYNGTNRVHAWLQLGDNAYNAGLDSEFQANMFNIYTNQLRRSTTWPTLGNHETGQLTNYVNTYAHFAIFTLPTAGEAGGVASGTEHYYSFDVGMVHFVNLDSMTASRATNGAMATWLRADLAATTNRWVIAYFHHPPYSKGSHDSDVGGPNYDTQMGEMRTNMLPILEAGGADLVLGGHSHCYERSFLINGHYGLSSSFTSANKVQAGSGRETNGVGAYLKPENFTGAPIGSRGTIYSVVGSSGQATTGTINHPAHYYSVLNLGSLVLDITSNRLDAVFLRETGATNDWFSILKNNYAPVASNLSLTIPANSATNLTLTGADVNRNVLTFATNSWTTNGLVSAFNPTNGTFTYTPARGATNGDKLFFSANDGRTNSATALVTINVTPPVDANTNGLADAWEAQFGITDPNADTDGDGVSNRNEYWAGTNPTNALSWLRATAITPAAAGFQVVWSAVGGVRYRIHFSNGDVNGGFTGAFASVLRPVNEEMNPAPVGDATTQAFTDDFTLTGGAPASGARYYRIEVVR